MKTRYSDVIGDSNTLLIVCNKDGIHSVMRNLLMKDQYMKQLAIGFSVFTIPRPVLIP
ncbi:hypothetical protein [Bacillus cereus]|uniref:hypothetical protein n=1 Tax=Bacillus cereus TaxID=1396 RepID=UPI0015D4CD6F|nr:hypothetical protein [Bacillus cereus]